MIFKATNADSYKARYGKPVLSSLIRYRCCMIGLLFLIWCPSAAISQTITVTQKNLVACRDLQTMKTLQNMIAVGETHISSIYLKKMSMKGICIKIRQGEKINVLTSTPDTEFFIFKRLLNGRKYYISSHALGSGS